MISSHAFQGYVEFRPGFEPRAGIRHVLFDFDGTLSLIREGWPNVMIPMFVEMLPARPGESQEDLARLVREDIMRLNGKQTIYQMMQLVERIRERGGEPRDPLEYKKEYLHRLDRRIETRKAGLRDGAVAADEWLVFGARRFLEALRAREIRMFLASGTDEVFVREEARLLGISQFFDGHIYGAQDDFRTFSKKMVIDRILREHGIGGESLAAFGDGYVEIQNTKEAGGMAVAVASDEANNGSGRVDAWKRERLLGVGADVVVADFRDGESLLDAIMA